MFGSFSPSNRTSTIMLVLVAAILMGAALLVGISDNPPGAFLAAFSGAALVTAFAHHWRSPRRFLALGAISLAVVVVFVLLTIWIDISVTAHRLVGPTARAVEAVGNAIALAVAFLVVPAILVGLVGGLVVWLLRRAR